MAKKKTTTKSSRKRPRALGRGLSSLMSQPVSVEPPEEKADTAIETTAVSSDVPRGTDRPENGEPAPPVETPPELQYLPVAKIEPNPHQPRQRFDEAALQRLATSIRNEGLMQPIVVRPASDNTAGYQIIAGERRWRAAQLAQLDMLPALVRELDDQQLAEWALIENLQREDLNPIEKAIAFDQLQKDFGLNHEKIAERVGLERSTVSNLLRLLNLSEHCRRLVVDGLLSMGQARALAGLNDGKLQQHLADQAIREGWSVRKVEQAVRKADGSVPRGTNEGQQGGSAGKTTAANKAVRSAHLADLEQQLGEQLGTRVRIRRGRAKGTGTLSIEFYSLEQFDDFVQRLGVTTE